MIKFNLIVFFIFSLSVIGNSQDCDVYNNSGNCKIILRRGYQLYQQPIVSAIGLNDTLSYNIVFNGSFDYEVTFCTNQSKVTLNIRLLQPETYKELYNNAEDDYIESLGFGFNTTQIMLLEVSLLANKSGKNILDSTDKICVGMAMQCKAVVEGNK